MNKQSIAEKLKEGDIIFTSLPHLPTQQIEKATDSRASHVGIAFKNGDDWVVAESRVPYSCYTPLEEFIERSKDEWFAVKRLSNELTNNDLKALRFACDRQVGILYHPGFKYESKRQFCSKFVYDAYKEVMGIDIGKIVSFKDLLDENPNASTAFWRVWYFGLIPWQRLTVTPASQYNDEKLLKIA